MKARVKETGEFVEITKIEDKLFIDNHYCPYEPYEIEWEVNDNDYWTRLEHQYAGMFLKSFLDKYDGSVGIEDIINSAIKVAHALVEKLKEMEDKA